MKALGDRVVLKMDEVSAKKGEIILPETARENPRTATVVEVGHGRFLDGRIIAPEVKKGDRVAIMQYAGAQVEVDGEKYVVVREDDIILVL